MKPDALAPDSAASGDPHRANVPGVEKSQNCFPLRPEMARRVPVLDRSLESSTITTAITSAACTACWRMRSGITAHGYAEQGAGIGSITAKVCGAAEKRGMLPCIAVPQASSVGFAAELFRREITWGRIQPFWKLEGTPIARISRGLALLLESLPGRPDARPLAAKPPQR